MSHYFFPIFLHDLLFWIASFLYSRCGLLNFFTRAFVNLQLLPPYWFSAQCWPLKLNISILGFIRVFFLNCSVITKHIIAMLDHAFMLPSVFYDSSSGMARFLRVGGFFTACSLISSLFFPSEKNGSDFAFRVFEWVHSLPPNKSVFLHQNICFK